VVTLVKDEQRDVSHAHEPAAPPAADKKGRRRRAATEPWSFYGSQVTKKPSRVHLLCKLLQKKRKKNKIKCVSNTKRSGIAEDDQEEPWTGSPRDCSAHLQSAGAVSKHDLGTKATACAD
jgi:hypothetical protein